MRKRNAFRPTITDVLEDRTLPSHAGLPAMTVGVLGDSYSDEGQFVPPYRSHARSAVEILAATRGGLNFGPFSAQTWDGVRGPGFAFHWAHDGDTSADMVRNQLPGLAAQVAQGKVNCAWVFIGSNDLTPPLLDAIWDRVPLAVGLARLDRVVARLEANFTETVNRLLAANPRARVVVSTLFDLSLMPWVPKFIPTPGGRALMAGLSQATQWYNDLVRATAAGNGRVALVDIAGLANQLVQQGGPAGVVSYGGTWLDLGRPGESLHHLFLPDKLHFGTLFQGMIANAFVGAVDAAFGAHVAPLTPAGVVSFARHVQAGAA